MRSVVRMLFAGAIAASAGSLAMTSARADALMWDGTLYITSKTAKCDPLEDVEGGMRAIYRPRLRNSDPEAAIIFQTNNLSHIYVIRAQTKTATLNGIGEYCGIDFDPGKGESSTWLKGTYSINVTPRNIDAWTPDVHLYGTVKKFGNIPGCTVNFRGAFLRRP